MTFWPLSDHRGANSLDQNILRKENEFMSDSKTHWENVYQKKSPTEVSWYQQVPEISLELIRKTGIKHDEPLVDVGGGASTLVDHLLKEGHSNVTVLDISQTALDVSKSRLQKDSSKNDQNVHWVGTDITEYHPSQQFHLWHDRAVFHFLTTPEKQQKYRKVLQQALTPTGYVIIATFALGGPQKCSGLDIVQYDGNKLLRTLGDKNFTLLETRDEVHHTPQGKPQKFTYFLLQKNE